MWPNMGVSSSASVLQMNIQGRFPFGLTGLISLQSKVLSRVFSNICSPLKYYWLDGKLGFQCVKSFLQKNNYVYNEERREKRLLGATQTLHPLFLLEHVRLFWRWEDWSLHCCLVNASSANFSPPKTSFNSWRSESLCISHPQTRRKKNKEELLLLLLLSCFSCARLCATP